jgi:hypothetical protein
MNEEKTQDGSKMKVSDMVRATANNTEHMLNQIANHIDKLEAEVIRLTLLVEKLEGTQSDTDAN